jgi:hypothetical protein
VLTLYKLSSCGEATRKYFVSKCSMFNFSFPDTLIITGPERCWIIHNKMSLLCPQSGFIWCSPIDCRIRVLCQVSFVCLEMLFPRIFPRHISRTEAVKSFLEHFWFTRQRLLRNIPSGTLRSWVRIPLKARMFVLVCSSSSFTCHPAIDAL